ncbi:MAG: molybdate ABC transporter substrate-binding protein [Nitrospirales bacterium]|nr:molybdate ABC transporter substrate-binding protein [Nitrospirales bacterium]
MKKTVVSILFAGAVFMASASAFAADLTVSAAISLKNAFTEIGQLFESQNKGSKVVFNFGASGDLMRQIEGGAPVDVFASAAQKDMDEANKKGLMAPGTRADFAANSVVLIVPASAKSAVKAFQDLTTPAVKRIATGNPKTVPAGRYADEVFAFYQIQAGVKEKLVYAENVRQVLDYVARGEVDAGVVYSTDALVSKDVRVVATAPDESHKSVIYPIAVVKGAKSEALGRGFIKTVMSGQGMEILKKYGFKAVKQK